MLSAQRKAVSHDVSSVPTVGLALSEGRARLAQMTTDSPDLEASLLLASILGQSRTWITAHPEAPLASEELAAFRRALAHVAQGLALPYVLGRWEFFGRDFEVTPAVLIPRPETECLVESALEFGRRLAEGPRAVDIGTGSGCIAVTLAASLPHSSWIATDIDGAALRVARRNALRHAIGERILFVCCDLTEALSGGFDLVCANLPYIPTARLPSLEVAQREPRRALDGGADGLALISILIRDLPRLLRPAGRALLEIDHTQAETVQRAARQADPQADITLLADLAGLPRILQIDRRNGRDEDRHLQR
jgi:release factor glutamine methyltransferase